MLHLTITSAMLFQHLNKNKKTENKKQKTKNRKQKTENRKQKTEKRKQLPGEALSAEFTYYFPLFVLIFL